MILEWTGGGATLLGGAGILIGGLILFVGPLRCLSAPAAARGRGLIVGAVVCQTLVGITFWVFLPMISWIASLASHILFVLFMRKIAAFIGRIDLIACARNIFIGGVIMASCFGIQGIAHLRATQPGGALITITGTTLAFVASVVYVMYLGMLNSLRHAIKNGARP